MKKKSGVLLFTGVGFICAFTIWTLLLMFVDSGAIGPLESRVGFSSLNQGFHSLTGTNLLLYEITDWLGILPIGVALGFAVMGLSQLIKRRGLLGVDHDLLALGVFYLVVILFFALFEVAVVNYRPILIDGALEASYPSSTTMLFTTVMPTAIIQLRLRVRKGAARRCLEVAIIVLTCLTVVGRLLSGVHWLTDIVGGLLLSVCLVCAYCSSVLKLKAR